MLMFAGLVYALWPGERQSPATPEWAAKTPAERAVMDAFKQGKQALSEQRFLQALAHLQTAEAGLARAPGVADAIKLRLYVMKGDAHWNLWQYVAAFDAYEQARALATPGEKRWLQERLAKLERVVEDSNTERDTQTVYRASPHVGPAAALKGHVAVAYVFLTDQGPGSWGVKRRDAALRSWSRAEQWLRDAAADHGATLRFTRRVFLVDRAPQLKRIRIGGPNQRPMQAALAAQAIAKQLGAKDVLGFLKQVRREEGADQAVLIVHLNRDERSFASRCMGRCTRFAEYAFLLEAAKGKRWQSMEYAQTHETLHLFGADDLYQIKAAKHFDVLDIMNYPSRVVGASTLGEVTAYAVGLRETKPDAPFRIINSRSAK